MQFSVQLSAFSIPAENFWFKDRKQNAKPIPRYPNHKNETHFCIEFYVWYGSATKKEHLNSFGRFPKYGNILKYSVHLIIARQEYAIPSLFYNFAHQYLITAIGNL